MNELDILVQAYKRGEISRDQALIKATPILDKYNKKRLRRHPNAYKLAFSRIFGE